MEGVSDSGISPAQKRVAHAWNHWVHKCTVCEECYKCLQSLKSRFHQDQVLAPWFLTPVFGSMAGYAVNTWKISVETKYIDGGAIVLGFRATLSLYIMLFGD